MEKLKSNVCDFFHKLLEDDRKYKWFINLTIILIGGVLFHAIFLSITRVFFYIANKPDTSIAFYKVALMLIYGVYIDLKTLYILFFPALVFIYLGLFIPGAFFFRLTHNLKSIYLTLVFITCFFLSGVNLFFYRVFQNNTDIQIFGIVEDGFKEVLASMIASTPLIPGLIILAIIALIMIFVIRWIQRWVYKKHLSARISKCIVAGYTIFIVVITPFSCIDRSSIIISKHNFINASVINGPLAMYFAQKDYKESKQAKTVNFEDKLKFGNSIKNISESYSSLNYSNETRIKDLAFDKLFRKTPKNSFLKNNPPHIIILVMESLSGDIIRHNSKEFNVLGNLDKHFKKDNYFPKTIASSNWTYSSIEQIILNRKFASVGNTPLREASYDNTFLTPFKNSGYKTVFAYSGDPKWRKIADNMKRAGFDRIIDQETIIKSDSKIKKGVWGIWDHHLFDVAYNIIDESNAKKEPTLLMLMTTSNHVPFATPESYKNPDLTIPAELKKRTLHPDPHMKKMIYALEYANNSAADLIDKVKTTKLKNNTIVVLTGDHNARDLVTYSHPSLLGLKYNVPMYFYIPSRYKKNFTYKPERFIGHKDIFPTLANLSLSEANYLSYGNNIFAEKSFTKTFFGENDELVASEHGAIHYIHNSKNFYSWDDEDKFLLRPWGEINKKELEELDEVQQSIIYLSDLNVISQYTKYLEGKKGK